jgi:hypothetical protein
VLTESSRRTCKSSRGSRRLGGRAVEDGGDTCRVAGGAYEVRYSQTVSKFGPQNLGRGSKEEWDGTWRNHRGCVEAKQICAGIVVVRSREIELDHNALRLGGSPLII